MIDIYDLNIKSDRLTFTVYTGFGEYSPIIIEGTQTGVSVDGLDYISEDPTNSDEFVEALEEVVDGFIAIFMNANVLS